MGQWTIQVTTLSLDILTVALSMSHHAPLAPSLELLPCPSYTEAHICIQAWLVGFLPFSVTSSLLRVCIYQSNSRRPKEIPFILAPWWSRLRRSLQPDSLSLSSTAFLHSFLSLSSHFHGSFELIFVLGIHFPFASTLLSSNFSPASAFPYKIKTALFTFWRHSHLSAKNSFLGITSERKTQVGVGFGESSEPSSVKLLFCFHPLPISKHPLWELKAAAGYPN